MTDKRLPDNDSEKRRDPDRLFRLEAERTESINLSTLFTSDVTSSGSFDIRGGIWASTFGKLLQSLPVPAFLVDGDHNLLVGNQACTRIDPEFKLSGSPPLTVLFPNQPDAARASDLLKEVFRSRKPGTMQGILQMGKNKIWGRLTFRSIRIVHTRFVLVLVEDLSNERRLLLLGRKHEEDLEARVEQRTAELTEANTRLQKEMAERKKAEDKLVQSERLRAVGEMSAGVAHNINNLIQMVLGLYHNAMNELDWGNLPGVRKELESIEECLQHGSKTVRRLQDFAGIREEGFRINDRVFDMSELVRQAVELTKPFWQTYPQSKGIKVDLKTDLIDGCFVRGDQAQIFEVLVNLIKNAAEAVIEGGKIAVSVSADNGRVVFSVRDTGLGIHEDNMPRLFTPFFTTKAETGTGLGLATSRGIIDAHGGTINVKSAQGKGTAFWVKLPQAPGPPQIEPSAAPTVHRKLNILSVDDMASTLMVLRLGLEGFHHKVFTAQSGEEALEIVRKNPIDLVLCDLAMPGMNGWEVGRRIRLLREHRQDPGPRFILLTAWGNKSFDETQVSESGVDAILEKPIDINELVNTIGMIMEDSA